MSVGEVRGEVRALRDPYDQDAREHAEITWPAVLRAQLNDAAYASTRHRGSSKSFAV